MSDLIMTDNEIDENDETNKTDFVNVGSSVIGNINAKLFAFMYIIGVIIFSDLFIDSVLSKIPNAVDGEYATTKGTLTQLTTLCVASMMVDVLIKYKWL